MSILTLQAPMPETSLPGGASIVCEAIHPTTGAQVAGVTVTTLAVYGYDEGEASDTINRIIPLLTPQDVAGS